MQGGAEAPRSCRLSRVWSEVPFFPLQVLGYYSGDENAYDMRKAMPRDVRGASVIPLKRPIRPEELEFD